MIGLKMAGTHWIPKEIDPFLPIPEEDFPAITGEWKKVLFTIKGEICSSCSDCYPPSSLCSKHSLIFEWLVRLGRANIPQRYWDLELEDTLITDRETLDFVRDACIKVKEVAERGLGFSLFGARGRGKTTLTIYFLKTALRFGFSGYFSLMEGLLNTVRESFNEEGNVARLHFQNIKHVKVLVLDDIGREHMTHSGFVVARLDELFRWRDSMGYSTLFTSNLNGEEFKTRYGTGIVSLLKNTNKVLVLKGDELRPALNEWSKLCPK